MNTKKLTTIVTLMLTACTAAVADEAQRRMNHVSFSGWDYVDYYVSFWFNRYFGYPWVVRMSYVIELLSIILIGVVLFCLCYSGARTWKHRRFQRKLRKAYDETMPLVFTSPRDMTETEIERAVMYDGKQLHGWRMRQLVRYFIRLRGEAGANCNFHNVNAAAGLFGILAYIGDGLAFGFKKYKISTLQAALYLHLPVPDSIIIRMFSHGNYNIRKSMRAYSISTSEDPMRFLEGSKTYEFRPWDILEIHEHLLRRRQEGRPIPSFTPYISSVADADLKACLIREVGWFGTKDDIKTVCSYFTDRENVVRLAAFECIGICKDTEAERAMIATYDVQNETQRRHMLMAVQSVQSGNAKDFLVEAYETSASERTRDIALGVLYNYGEAGRNEFYRLKMEHATDELLFEQVECRLPGGGGMTHLSAI